MNNFLILNKYEKVEYNFPDEFDIKIFYLNENLCEIYCKRLDSSSGWGLNLEIKIYDIEIENYFEIITIGNSEENIKNAQFSTSNIKLKLNINIDFSIPKIIYPRNDILISNKYEIINFDNFFSNEINTNNFIDFHIVAYYINEYKLKLIIRRLDEEYGWDCKIKLLLYDNNNLSIKEYINIDTSEYNFKILFLNTKLFLNKLDYNYEQEIPKIIFQTGNSNKFKNILHYNSIMTFIELNPEYTYIYFDDISARKFLRENFNNDVNYAYDSLVPGAFKADLLRYCFLFNNGGCYFDCKQILKIPIRMFLENDKTLILCNDVIEKALLNAIIFSNTKNIIMEKAIKDCVYNIVNKFGTEALDITGPIFFYKSIYNFINNENLILQNNRPPNNFIDFTNDYYNNNITLIKNNKVIINRFYKGYYNNYLDINHYGKLYNNDEIYYKNFQNLSKIKICIYPNKYNDKFIFYIKNDTLTIKRTDSTDGWHFDLKVLIIDGNYKDMLVNIGKSETNSKEVKLFQN
jgi:mannosyltransferase OCH1-like enzyme